MAERCPDRADLAFRVEVASTLGTFLRSFRRRHVRQLPRVSRELLGQAWTAGAGRGSAPLTIDLDSHGGGPRRPVIRKLHVSDRAEAVRRSRESRGRSPAT